MPKPSPSKPGSKPVAMQARRDAATPRDAIQVSYVMFRDAIYFSGQHRVEFNLAIKAYSGPAAGLDPVVFYLHEGLVHLVNLDTGEHAVVPMSGMVRAMMSPTGVKKVKRDLSPPSGRQTLIPGRDTSKDPLEDE